METNTPPLRRPIVLMLLTVPAALLHGALAMAVLDQRWTGPAGLAHGDFILLVMFYLWLLLGIMLVAGNTGGGFSRGIGFLAAAVVPVSAVALLLATETEGTRLIGLSGLLLLPVLYAAYAWWARLPALRQVIPAGRANAIVWGTACLFTLFGLSPLFR